PAGMKGSQHDGGHLYVWPKQTPLFLVDADETLCAEELEESAAATLKKASEQGWRIVYLALAGAQVRTFLSTRAWIRSQVKLPKGPILGQAKYYPNAESSAQARRQILDSLKQRFQGPLVVVVKSAEAAQTCKDVGVRTIVVGADAAPAGVEHVASWADV